MASPEEQHDGNALHRYCRWIDAGCSPEEARARALEYEQSAHPALYGGKTEMDEIKALLTSKTLWALLATGVAYMATSYFGFTITDGDQEKLIEAGVVLGGLVAAGIFRILAKKRVVIPDAVGKFFAAILGILTSKEKTRAKLIPIILALAVIPLMTTACAEKQNQPQVVVNNLLAGADDAYRTAYPVAKRLLASGEVKGDEGRALKNGMIVAQAALDSADITLAGWLRAREAINAGRTPDAGAPTADTVYVAMLAARDPLLQLLAQLKPYLADYDTVADTVVKSFTTAMQIVAMYMTYQPVEVAR